jgi:hypothetical protein
MSGQISESGSYAKFLAVKPVAPHNASALPALCDSGRLSGGRLLSWQGSFFSQCMRRNQMFLAAGNLLGGIALVLLLLDPDRPLWPIFVLLGVGVALVLVAVLLRRSS